MPARSPLRSFFRRFPDDDACLQYLFELRFGPGYACPACQRSTRWRRIRSERAYSCQWCGHHLHPTAGTLLEKTRIPLLEWFYVMYRFSEPGADISAKRLVLEIGCSYRNATHMRRSITRLVAELEEESQTGKIVPLGEGAGSIWGDLT